MDSWLPAVGALVPSLGVGVLFYLAMRHIVRADRNERAALARMEADEEMSRAAHISARDERRE